MEMIAMIACNRELRMCLALVLFLMSGWHALASTPLPTPTLDVVKKRVGDAIRDAANNKSLGVDPVVGQEIVADSVGFVANFCGEYAPKGAQDPCTAVFFNEDELRSIVAAFLADALRRPAKIETISSRMAHRAGLTMADVGIAEKRENYIGIVQVPERFRRTDISLRTAYGLERIGSAADFLLLSPGNHDLVATAGDGSVVSVRVEMPMLGTGRWKEMNEADATTGRIDVPLESFCSPSGEIKLIGALAMFNAGRAKISESREEAGTHTMPVALQTGIDISVLDETGLCDNVCMKGIGVAFAKAIAIWRSGCERCRGSALSVVRVGSSVWLDRKATNRIRRILQDRNIRVDFDLGKSLPDETLTYINAPSPLVPRSAIVGFSQVDGDNEVINVLCGLGSSTGSDWVNSARGFLCDGSPQSKMVLLPTLEIKKTPTDCGEMAIACAVPGGKVQITIRDYEFRISTPSGTTMLRSATSKATHSLGPILVHEVGHWFGVPHPEMVGVLNKDIMSGVFNPDNVCVSAQSLIMLDNATDDRWQYRAKNNQALLPLSTKPNSQFGSDNTHKR
ncbi:hypothetical protein [Achromobacter denitrificans]|uniref:hypothetical protein n=1 Tax=Achromobacter denitrificans TaxID=32002 RepID=UPI001055B97A|nr:hypothetical protein [Achromobacter denitrificans]QKH42332.1 hypothetical protein FOC82_12935 [Achromobacter denitrificans]QKH50526.1 hypothetical protein FOC80_14215 [Achromobacter denitrificans]